MKYSPAKILQAHLVSSRLFTRARDNQAWPLFVSSTPETPDNCGTVYDTEGTLDGVDRVAGEVVEHPGIQVRIRAANYDEGWEKAQVVRDLLVAVSMQDVVVERIHYLVHAITQTSSVVSIGVEEGTGRRELFTINFLVTLSEVQS